MADALSVIVPAVSGLGGVALGGCLTYWVEQQRVRAQEAVRRAEWDREDIQRRRSLYADFMAVATSVMTSWLDIAGRALSSEIMERLDDQREDDYRELHKIASLVRITASREVAEKAEDVMAVIRHTQAAIATAKTMGTLAAPSNEWTALEAQFADARDDFVNTIRQRRSGQRPEP